MTTSDTIRFKCPNCGAIARGHRKNLERDLACPKCKVTVRFEAMKPEAGVNSHKPVEEVKEPHSQQLPSVMAIPIDDDRREAHNDIVPKISISTTMGMRQCRRFSDRLDMTQTASVWIAAAGFIFLFTSPFLRWVNVGAGGFIGIAGDGKYLLGAAIVTGVLFGISIARRPLLTVPLMISQGVGTMTTFWMGGLLWRLSNTFNINSDNENPIGGLFASLMVSPGAGLYFGLLGGVLVAATSGYLVFRQPRFGAIPAVLNQVLFICMGIVLVVYLGRTQDLRQRSVDVEPNAQVPNAAAPAFPFLANSQDSMTEWKQKYKVTEKQWDEMFANYQARIYPKDVSRRDWWEQAKSRTPAQLNAVYPPLEPREWYVATWIDSFSPSRELDSEYDITSRETTYALTLKLRVRTPPNVPIKEVHGRLAFVTDGKPLFTKTIAEVPDVSFTNSLLVWVKIAPYDDSNAVHRDLRYTEESELTPIFSVSRVVFADGTEQQFD